MRFKNIEFKNLRCKKLVNKALSFLLACGLTFSMAQTNVNAEIYWPDAGTMESECAIVMEMNTGTILYGQNIDEQRYPASITKVFTALLVLENCDMDEIVTFSDDAVEKNEGDTSHIARDYGEKMTVEECMYAMMMFSANECAYALAEHVGEKLGGDYSTFIDLMNKRAKELGCTNSHFANPNGLPNDDHYVSARDMALIASEAYKNETFRIILSTKTYTIPPTNKHSEPTILYCQHQMYYPSKTRKYLYEYCTGGKTGFTDVARNTLVTYAEKDGMKLVCVILKSSSTIYYNETIQLMEFGFNNFHLINIAENESSISDESLKSMGILNNYQSFASLDQNASICIPATAEITECEKEIITDKAGEGNVAKIQYTYAGREVGAAKIVAKAIDIPEDVFEDKLPEDTGVEQVVKIKPIWILFVVLGLVALCFLIYFIRKLIENYYWIRHQREVKKARRARLNGKVADKPRKRRKRDRLFR